MIFTNQEKFKKEIFKSYVMVSNYLSLNEIDRAVNIALSAERDVEFLNARCLILASIAAVDCGDDYELDVNNLRAAMELIDIFTDVTPADIVRYSCYLVKHGY